MPNSYFRFKQFTIRQERSPFKVGTDGVLLGACAGIGEAGNILDIGTGTGLVALMLAQRSNAEILALEPDHDSYLQACENFAASPWSDRIRTHCFRLQEFFPAGRRFDLIVSNPPYFIDSLKNPDSGIAAARHDISLTQDDLLEGATRLLEENGRFEVIMPYAEGTILIRTAGKYDLYCNSMIRIKPLPSSDVKRLVLSFSRQSTPVVEKTVTIEKGGRHDFTDEYIDLTKEFYLKF
jgi:tRNA1Val (adenine37-N6)-methyltransferase